MARSARLAMRKFLKTETAPVGCERESCQRYHSFSMDDRKHTLSGNIQQHARFASRVLQNERDILVYLPIGYRRSRQRRYPVLYLHDGQNVFDAATAFGGVEWGVDETAERLTRQRLIEPLIIVAVQNLGAARIDEYSPTRGLFNPTAKRHRRSRGLLRKYGKFLATELKPFIDQEYRTKPEAEFTGLGGSSLGGLATLVLALWFPQVFTRLAVMSPSIWWDDCAIYKFVDQLRGKPPLKIWLDTGTNEPGWERAAILRDKLLEKGWRLYDDLQYTEAEGADHSEGAWGFRFEAVLRFLFPPAPSGMREPPPKPEVLVARVR